MDSDGDNMPFSEAEEDDVPLSQTTPPQRASSSVHPRTTIPREKKQRRGPLPEAWPLMCREDWDPRVSQRFLESDSANDKNKSADWWENKSPELVSKATDQHVKKMTESFVQRKKEQKERAAANRQLKRDMLKKKQTAAAASQPASRSSISKKPSSKKSTSTSSSERSKKSTASKKYVEKQMVYVNENKGDIWTGLICERSKNADGDKIHSDIYLIDFSSDPDMADVEGKKTFLYWQDEIYKSCDDAVLRKVPCHKIRPEDVCPELLTDQ